MPNTLIYPLILIAGLLQAWGPPMNGALRQSMVNPWLASTVSFLPIVAVLATVFFCLPRPLPSQASLAAMPWWAPLGGVIGSLAVVAGLLFVDKVGAGPVRRPDHLGQSADVDRHRPVRPVPHAAAPGQRTARPRRRPDGRRRRTDRGVLKRVWKDRPRLCSCDRDPFARAQRDPTASSHVWMALRINPVLSVDVGPEAVTCPAFRRGWWPLAQMRSANSCRTSRRP